MFKKTVETFALLLFVIQCHGAVTQLAGILRDVEERLQPLYPSTLSTGSPRPCCIEAVVKEERTFIARMDCPGFNNKSLSENSTLR